ncbi:MAG TPA: D-2-hydroxyacid dehydrogenase [Acidimicrobiia bacterium]|nr:D-2-hydroxyacid dehydrogenase [Acidimicrobiia bacterium]
MVTAPVRVVVGPVGGSGIGESIAAVAGVEVTVIKEKDAVPVALESAAVLVSFRWSGSWLTPGLRWIQSVSAGTDQFPLSELAANGTVLTSARGIHEPQVSEHAIGLLLSMTRGIATAVRQQHDSEWKWTRAVELQGMTLGVLGLGIIGEGVARRAAAFGMTVIGTKANPTAYRGAAVEVFPPERTREVFSRSDAVIITLPGGEGTRHLVGREELEALRGGWLVNVGRGAVIDEVALIAALRDGVLAGAALDVFETEPLPADSPLWTLPGVVISPHMAGASPKYGERLAALFARNLKAFQGTGEWENRVV